MLLRFHADHTAVRGVPHMVLGGKSVPLCGPFCDTTSNGAFGASRRRCWILSYWNAMKISQTAVKRLQKKPFIHQNLPEECFTQQAFKSLAGAVDTEKALRMYESRGVLWPRPVEFVPQAKKMESRASTRQNIRFLPTAVSLLWTRLLVWNSSKRRVT